MTLTINRNFYGEKLIASFKTHVDNKSKPLRIRCNLKIRDKTAGSTRDLRSNGICQQIARET